MPLVKITDATDEPITLDQAKRHLRETLVDADNDADITDLITVARQACEDRIQRSLLSTDWLLSLDDFPTVIELRRPPVQEVLSVKYVDPTGLQQTMAPGSYLLDPHSQPARLIAAPGTAWPACRSQPGAVQVSFRSGFADAATVPRPLVAWIKLALTDLYEQRSRSAERPSVPQHFAEGLLDVHNVWVI